MAKSVSHPISTPALGLKLRSQVDMECDTDFEMYHSLCIIINPRGRT